MDAFFMTIGLALSVALFCYLVYVMIRPELF
jgi:K+-transporting ATPase KdpF subunit